MPLPTIDMRLMELLHRLHDGELGLNWSTIGISGSLVDSWRRNLCRTGGGPIPVDVKSLVKLCTTLNVGAEELPLDDVSRRQVAARLIASNWQPAAQPSLLDLLSLPAIPPSGSPGELVSHLSRRLDAHVRSIAGVAQSMAKCLPFHASLGACSVGRDEAVENWLRRLVERNPSVLGMCLAMEPSAFAGVEDYTIYIYRRDGRIERRADFAENYRPHYRDWEWYRAPRESQRGEWIPVFFDEGGGDAWMVTYSAPILHKRKFLGVVTVDVAQGEFDQVDAWLGAASCQARSYAMIVSDGLLLKPPPGRSMPAPPPGQLRLQDRGDLQPMLAAISNAPRGALRLIEPLGGTPAELYVADVSSTGWKLAIIAPKGEGAH